MSDYMDCPGCAGAGGEEYDTTDSSFEHAARLGGECSRCGGSGEIEVPAMAKMYPHCLREQMLREWLVVDPSAEVYCASDSSRGPLLPLIHLVWLPRLKKAIIDDNQSEVANVNAPTVEAALKKWMFQTGGDE